jgi:predicted glycosyltransferase
MDYEHSSHAALTWSSRSIWLPDLLQDSALPAKTRRLARFFAGLKENLYLDGAQLSREAERSRLGVVEATFLVVARPPASTAHYASADSMTVWIKAVTLLSRRPGVSVMVLCRTQRQRDEVATLLPTGSIEILPRTVDGPSMIAAADLVVSGGGTMNREATVLGVPAWSVFTGATPHIDERLAGEGRLRWVRSEEELARAVATFPEPLHPRRGPYPEGIAAILGDIGQLLGVRIA